MRRWEEAVTLLDNGRSRPAVRRWEEATTCHVRSMGGEPLAVMMASQPRPDVRRWEEALGGGRDAG